MIEESNVDYSNCDTLDKTEKIIFDYLTGEYRLVDLGRKYNMIGQYIRHIIYRNLSEEIINDVESKAGRMTQKMRSEYLKSVGSNIIEDYRTCEFFVKDLVEKYNLSSWSIIKLLRSKLSDFEYNCIKSKHLSKSQTIYDEEFQNKIICDYKTGNYYEYELAEKYDVHDAIICRIVCKYISKLERKTIQNDLYNRNCIDGDINGRPYRASCGNIGIYFSEKCRRDIIYRSRFEKMAIEILENDSCVINYIYEPIRITYGNGRTYIPDFKVEYNDGRIVIIEVKMKCEVDWEVNKLKFAAAKKYCEDNNMEFIVWSESFLKK